MANFIEFSNQERILLGVHFPEIDLNNCDAIIPDWHGHMISIIKSDQTQTTAITNDNPTGTTPFQVMEGYGLTEPAVSNEEIEEEIQAILDGDYLTDDDLQAWHFESIEDVIEWLHDEEISSILSAAQEEREYQTKLHKIDNNSIYWKLKAEAEATRYSYDIKDYSSEILLELQETVETKTKEEMSKTRTLDGGGTLTAFQDILAGAICLNARGWALTGIIDAVEIMRSNRFYSQICDSYKAKFDLNLELELVKFIKDCIEDCIESGMEIEEECGQEIAIIKANALIAEILCD